MTYVRPTLRPVILNQKTKLMNFFDVAHNNESSEEPSSFVSTFF